MIFGLPPILGLIPLILYAVLALKEVHPFIATLISVIAATILSGSGFMGLARAVAAGSGSFLGQIGLMVMFGAGLAEILKDSGSANLIVKWVMSKFPVTKHGIIVGTMVCSILMIMGLGSMIAGGSMVATVAVTLAASKKVSTPAMAIAFHTSGAAGLILGPFTAPTVQMLNITGWNYGQWLLYVAGPFAVIMLATGIFMSFRAERKYGEQSGNYVAYPDEEAADYESEAPPTKEAKRGAYAFVGLLIPLVVYGIIIKGGMTYALLLIPTLAILVGLIASYKPLQLMEVFMRGASRMVWFYLMFVLFDPFVNMLTATGAFAALGDLLAPLLGKTGIVGFTFIAACVGVFGINGAAVAQVEILHGMFETMAQGLGVVLPLYISTLLIGGQITSFAYPGADMMSELGLARSGHVKSMMVNGWVVTGAMLAYLVVRAIFNI